MRTVRPGDGRGRKGAVIVGQGFAVQANIMVSDRTVKNMAETFVSTRGALTDRLMAALKAEARPVAETSGECSRLPSWWCERTAATWGQRPVH